MQPQLKIQNPPQQMFNNTPFSLMDSVRFKFHTLNEAAAIAEYAARLFKDKKKIQSGLYELLANAVEHGCYGIGHGQKQAFLKNKSYSAEIARLESLPENRTRFADVVIGRRPEGIVAIISDPGDGFDWRAWNLIDPSSAGAPNGRGIARARHAAFDYVSYNEKGNQTIAFTRDLAESEW